MAALVPVASRPYGFPIQACDEVCPARDGLKNSIEKEFGGAGRDRTDA